MTDSAVARADLVLFYSQSAVERGRGCARVEESGKGKGKGKGNGNGKRVKRRCSTSKEELPYLRYGVLLS
jgi:hypothetical protein